jgi:hypothetical protein
MELADWLVGGWLVELVDWLVGLLVGGRLVIGW